MGLTQPGACSEDVKVGGWDARLWAAGWPVCKDDPSFEAPNEPVFLLFGLALMVLCQNPS